MTDKITELKQTLAAKPSLSSGVVGVPAVQQRVPSQYQTIQELFKRMEPEIAKALPKHITVERLTRVALTEVRKNPKLLECTTQSLLGALMLSAQLGLEPGILGHAYMIPYYNGKTKAQEVQFQIGYKGYLDLVRRSGELRTIDVHEVCKNDFFEYEYGLEPKLRHKPVLDNRGEPYCYYAVAHFKDGGFSFLVLSVSDVEKFRKRSKSPDFGPWGTDYDAMAKKTVIKQLCKFLPLSPEIQRGIVQDETTKKEYEEVFEAKDETDWISITSPDPISDISPDSVTS